jgi:hypothetical protein
MVHWYRTYITDAGRGAVFWMLIAFVVTFALTRGITRRIRGGAAAPKEGERGGASGRSPARGDADAEAGERRRDGGLVKDIHIGGVHVHHQVFGILLVLVSGVLQFAYQPDSPGFEILGAAFGAGAALTLDEFALWLHLDDVYWSREGQKSIDAVVIGVCVCGVLLIGTSPFGVERGATSQETLGTLATTVLVNAIFAVFAFLKGKLATGAIGLLIPLVALVGAVRLAKPTSPWARWRYGTRPRKLERAQRRFARYDERWDRVRAALGGAPTRG